MSKVAVIGNRSFDRVRYCFAQDGLEFTRVPVREHDLTEIFDIPLAMEAPTGLSILLGEPGQGKTASLVHYLEQMMGEVGNRPDVWVLDWSVLFSERFMPTHTVSMLAPMYEALLREFTTRLYAERTPLLFLSGELSDLDEVRSLLASGIADYVRLSTPETTEDTDLGEDDSQEVCERVHLLLDRVHSHKSQEEQRLDTDRRVLVAPIHDLPNLHNHESGRLDAIQIAEFFGLSQAALGRILGVSRAALNKTPDAVSLQLVLQPWAYVAGALQELVGSKEATRAWLHTANPLLEDHTPLSLMQDGDAEIVASVLRDALMGQPA